MTSYATVEAGIEAEVRALGELADALASAYDEEAEAAIAWKGARARARIALREEHRGERYPVEWYDDMAHQSAPGLFDRHVRAVNRLALLREERSIRTTRLDGLRTLAAGIRGAGG